MVELDDETDDSHSMEVRTRCKIEDSKSVSVLMTVAAKYFIISLFCRCISFCFLGFLQQQAFFDLNCDFFLNHYFDDTI